MGADLPVLMGHARGGTLFLDRDGVVNRKVDGDYVRGWAGFEFLPGALEALARLAGLFGTIVVVTNQRGVGRGLMRETDLADIHRRMVAEVERAGGRIDGVYHCPHDLDVGCQCRKPGLGLVRQAMREHPGIDLLRSVLAGDSESDMALARRLGVPGILVGDGTKTSEPPHGGVVFGTLLDFSVAAAGALAGAGLVFEGGGR